MPHLLKPAQTFCNLPFCDDLAKLDCDVAILGAPHGTPYMPGTPSHAANATGAVRRALGWFSAAPTQIDFDT
ncbi:MAG: hypothetical protein IT562_01800, partial [Alphaproteobacteria bacterium]|nr:hypothetical protein [Alphaproteobacteria bacterium]